MRAQAISVEIPADREILPLIVAEDTYSRVRRVLDEALALLELPESDDDRLLN